MSKTKEIVIQYVGKRKIIDAKTGKKKLVPAEAPVRRVNGSMVFILPSDEIQKSGFSHRNADFLLKHYPRDFKVKTSKGKGK